MFKSPDKAGRDAVFNVPSQLIRRSPKNPEVTVTLSDDPTVVATGHVRQVAPQADAATGTYVVKVGLDNPPDIMRLGADPIQLRLLRHRAPEALKVSREVGRAR